MATLEKKPSRKTTWWRRNLPVKTKWPVQTKIKLGVKNKIKLRVKNKMAT